jgi:short-subunit dehydrogenase
MLVVLAGALGGCATDRHAREQRTLAGKTVVITGATSGFGRGVALRMAQNNAHVVICARDGDALADVAREAAEVSPGVEVTAVQVDVGKPEDMARLA